MVKNGDGGVQNHEGTAEINPYAQIVIRPLSAIVGQIEQSRPTQHFSSNHRVIRRKNVTCPKQAEVRRQRSRGNFVGNTGRNLGIELHQSLQVQLDQV